MLFLDSLIVSLCLKYLVQSSKWRVELRVWEVAFFPVPEEVIYSLLVYFGIVQICPMYGNLDKKVWFAIIFLPLKECLTVFQIWIFYYTFTYFVPFGVIKNRVTKVNSKSFNGNCAKAWLFEKCIFELQSWTKFLEQNGAIQWNSNWSWKRTGLSKDQKFLCSDNPGQNIWNKMK